MADTTIAAVILALSLVATAPAEGGRNSSGCAAEAIETGRRIERSIEVGGVERDFILDVPPGARPGEPVALLFDFHGFGHSGAGVWKVSKFRDLAEEHRFITVYPTGLPVTLTLRGESHRAPGWQMEAQPDNRDLAFTRAVLADLEDRYCFDRDRVYATGFSNGAFFSSLLGCEMSETFAAVAPVSGGALRDACEPERPVAVLIHHGTRDDLIPIERARASRDQWLEANGCAPEEKKDDGSPACQTYAQCRGAAKVVYCEEDFAHRWPAQATERIWTFFTGLRSKDLATDEHK